MAKDQVKVNIQGIPPKWLSYEISGDHEDVIEALCSVMKLHGDLFTIFDQACNKYKNENK